MNEQPDQQEQSLVRAVHTARDASAAAGAALRALRDADRAVRRAAAANRDVVPSWAGGALSACLRAADEAFRKALAEEQAVLGELSKCIDRRLAAAAAARIIAVKG